MITFEEVKIYRDTMYPKLSHALLTLEEEIQKQVAKSAIPHCSIKWRVKSAQSIYKKTKIKELSGCCDLDKKIQDYAGLRLLVLFEDDLVKLHKVVLAVMPRCHYVLKEFKLFNWDDKNKESELLAEIERNSAVTELGDDTKDYKYMPANPDSGYRSIHYLLEKKGEYYVEVQLRTYLQDVWGELEHSIVYKQGRINPFIKESFVKLAQELSIKDKNVQYLKLISDKEMSFNRVVRKNEIICPYFTHNKSLLLNVSLDLELYKEYVEHASVVPAGEEEKKIWIETGMGMLSELYDRVKSDSIDKKNLWHSTERAYWFFHAGQLREAREDCVNAIILRDKIRPDWGYTINLRVGESYSMEGNIDNALIEFDKSEALIPVKYEDEEVSIFQLKKILAYHYWMLGPDFYKIALQKIKEAVDIYEKSDNKGSYQKNIAQVNNNNLCWYQLEVCIKEYNLFKASMVLGDLVERECETELDKAKQKVREYLIALTDSFGKEPNSNGYDTAAWAYYNLYIMEGIDDDLKRAVEYSDKALKSNKNGSKQIHLSMALQKSHFQDIMHMACEKGVYK